MIDPWVTMQKLVAVLTAIHDGDIDGVTKILNECDQATLAALVIQACGMLHIEISHSATDDMTVENYLQMAGLVAAEQIP